MPTRLLERRERQPVAAHVDGMSAAGDPLLTVNWVRWTRSSARVKLPASTTETKPQRGRNPALFHPIQLSTESHSII
jgi:hypothetical protein